MVKILLIFVDFLENVNFSKNPNLNPHQRIRCYTKDLYQVQETGKSFFLTYMQLCVPTPIYRMSKVMLEDST